MAKLSQNEKVKRHLEKYKSITTFQAFVKYRITRLNARIFNLRDSGMDIRAKRIEDKKNGTHYNKYYL